MNIKHAILPTVCCLPLLSACASYQPANTAAWVIKPVTSVRNSTDKPEAYYQLGRYYQGQNRYDQAALAYRKALAVDNNFVEARNGLGVIYSAQGKYAEAIEVLKLAVQQAPQAAHIYNNLGYAYYLQGDNDEAIVALRVAAKLDPNNQRALNNLGQAYAKAGDHSGAIVAFTQATEHADAVLSKLVPNDNNTASIPALAHSPVLSAVPESLALPQDKGIIRRVTVPQIDSQLQAVQVSPNVYELHERTMPITTIAEAGNTVQTRLEIANGNGVTGMAKKVKIFLGSKGYTAERITNQKPYKVQVTQIQYRNGHQLEAQRLQLSLPKHSDLVQNNAINANINVRLVLGKDITEHVAFFEGRQEKVRLALNEK